MVLYRGHMAKPGEVRQGGRGSNGGLFCQTHLSGQAIAVDSQDDYVVIAYAVVDAVMYEDGAPASEMRLLDGELQLTPHESSSRLV
jgi:hypothetical protein